MAEENNFVPTETAPSVVPQPQVSPQQPAAPVQQQPNERTQDQFEKLLESNRSLHTQLQSLQTRMAPPAPQPTPQQQRNDDTADFVEIGPDGDRYVNEQKLSQSFKQMREEAAAAKRMAQQVADQAQNAEIERQNREAYSVYPELNPDSKDHDKRFSTLVRSTIFDSLMSPNDYGGRSLSFKEAAAFVRSQNPAQPKAEMDTNAEKEAEAKAAQAAQATAQELRQQSTVDVQNQPNARAQEAESIDIETLRLRTRHGDDDALARRLAAIDHVGVKPERED